MKVKLEENYKSIYTIQELEMAKEVIKIEKDDEDTAKSWAEYAVREALKNETGDFCREVIKAEATTAKNCRVHDAYGEGTGCMDVWIEAVAETSDGFIKVGAYLSDIWNTGGVDYLDKMYIVRYKKV